MTNGRLDCVLEAGMHERRTGVKEQRDDCLSPPRPGQTPGHAGTGTIFCSFQKITPAHHVKSQIRSSYQVGLITPVPQILTVRDMHK